MEEHTLLRVPEQLRDRVSLAVNNTENSSSESMSYERVSGRDYLFCIGKQMLCGKNDI